MLVVGVSDLPSSIACGACALQPGSGFPLSLAEASSKGRAEEAYPVLVLGTQVSLPPSRRGQLSLSQSTALCLSGHVKTCTQGACERLVFLREL